VAIGASGAPTLQKFVAGTSGAGSFSAAPSGGWQGVASVTRNSTGNYTVTLQDAFVRLLGAEVAFAATDGLPAAPIVGIDKDTTLSTALVGGKDIVIQCASSAGVAADPASGERLLATFTLANSVAV
jgi:hypothetical protein